MKIIWITTPETIQHDKDLAAYNCAVKNYEATNKNRRKQHKADNKSDQTARGVFVRWSK